MQQTQRVLEQFESQAQACEKLGSPFTARLCRVLARRLDARSRFGARILGWEGDPYADNVALRACGAIHALARSGWEPALAKAYPPNPTSENAVWSALIDALGHNDAFLTERLSSPPQTNEVARSALILGGMLHLASVVRMPLELLEIGASAGLNLAFDEYRYELGEGRVWGPRTAPLTVECAWRGRTPPLDAPVAVASRAGCDLRPVDPANPEDRARLTSYVWPDQINRLQRVEAALALAGAKGRRVDGEDAAPWLERHLLAPQEPYTTRVLLHTIVWDYVPVASKARINELVAGVGAAATPERPFARLTVESDETPGSARISLQIWPDGRTVTLGRGDYHGRWAEWQ